MVACTPTNSPPNTKSKPIQRKDSYINNYLGKMSIRLASNATVFIIYTDRCNLCSAHHIDLVRGLLNSVENHFILNYPDEEIEARLRKWGTVHHDQDDNLTRYGLNHVDNQYFEFKNRKLIKNGLIIDSLSRTN